LAGVAGVHTRRARGGLHAVGCRGRGRRARRGVRRSVICAAPPRCFSRAAAAARRRGQQTGGWVAAPA
jgi:hypothetical protein